MANFITNGYIVSSSILSQPTYVFGGQTLSSYLSSVSIRLVVQREGGLAENIDTDLLSILGDDGATLTISTVLDTNPLEIIFDLADVQQGLEFPIYSNNLMVVKLTFSQWYFYNSELGHTYTYSFNYTQTYHPQALQYAGELTISDITSDIDNFYINGYTSNLVAQNGSIFDLFSHYTITDGNGNDYALWDLIKYGYTITTDKESFLIPLTINGTTTQNAITSLNNFFVHCDNFGSKTTITLTISYWDSVAEEDKTLDIEFAITLNGIVSLTVSSLDDFVEQPAKNSMVKVMMTTTNGIGIADIPGSLPNYYNSASLTFTNDDTSQVYNVGDMLDNGHYTVSVGIVINPMFTKYGTTTIRIYETDATSLFATLIDNNYRVYTTFKDTQIILYAQYLIYGNDYTRVRVYYPNFSSDYNNHRFVPSDYPSVNITITYGALTTTVVAYVYFNEKDELWVYDKKTLNKINYGEIQQDFNMNFVIDGTKDNGKVRLLNHIKEDIKPNTIAYMPSTDTWWIVKEDKATRHDNEENALWQHDVSLLGLIEILNARDLVGCGFNVNHYTIEQFLNRLVRMCDFEIPIEFDFGTYVNPNENVDYLKTFENYSPLSAIKEFCDGINMTPKMKLETNNDFSHIEKAIIYFIPKSGTNDPIIDISTFDDSEEIITSDKENYGSKVISNVQNVVSGKVIRYPAVGTVHISSETNKVQYESAVLRLPTKANYVKSLDIYGKVQLYIKIGDQRNNFGSASDICNPNAIDDIYASALDYLNSWATQHGEPYIVIRDQFVSDEQKIKEYIKNNGFIHLENGAEYIQIDKDDDWSGNWNGKQVELAFRGSPQDAVSGHPGIGGGRSNSIGLNDKKHYDTFPQQVCLVYWEQGSDLIKNFRFYDKFTSNQNDYTYQETTEKFVDGNYAGVDQVQIGIQVNVNLISNYEATYVVHYIPMTDMKLKVENGIYENDSHLYNQNGTMVSSKAISKLVNSHAKSISSNQITRYKRYYSFDNVPSVGQMVDNNGEKYIINNVSIDFIENDNNDYVLDCEFTLTKQIACKSTMISANTNIRDYNTPQNHNVYRVQNYRDIIYFDYESVEQDTHMPISNLFNLPNNTINNVNKGYIDTHTAVMKIKWAANNTNYYQLPCIKYELEKMVVEVIDFKDNNIIGYAVQNTTHPFQVSNWWVGTDLIQVPVSYVDDMGHLIGLEILMCDIDQLTTAYDTLGQSSIYSASCIVPQSLYTTIGNNYDAKITENDYDKDGLEIPMFIYSCQAIDNKEIIVGSDFLNSDSADDNSLYVYVYYITEDRITEENALMLLPNDYEPKVDPFDYEMSVKQEITIDNSNNDYVDLTFHKNSTIDLNDFSAVRSYLTDSVKDKNIAIYLFKYDTYNATLYRQFLLGINNCKIDLTNHYLRLYKNGKKVVK